MNYKKLHRLRSELEDLNSKLEDKPNQLNYAIQKLIEIMIEVIESEEDENRQ